jgi:hypothetical protein
MNTNVLSYMTNKCHIRQDSTPLSFKKLGTKTPMTWNNIQEVFSNVAAVTTSNPAPVT